MTEQALPLLKALADESRLRIVGLLAIRERSVDELAALLELRTPTVSHHLTRLRDVGLVSMRAQGNVHVYTLEIETLQQLSRDVLSQDRIAAFADANEDSTWWTAKVMRDFFTGPRLKAIPASRKKRDVILGYLAQQFEPHRRFTEREVNEVLKRHHEDAATLRRELVGAGLLEREASVYWRAAR
jgi:hypothetical protein